MNEKLAKIFEEEGYDIPLLNGKKLVKDMIIDNYNYMVNGHGEGIVLCFKDLKHDGYKLLKWKIGIEPQLSSNEIFKNYIKDEIWKEISENEEEKK